MKPWKSAEKEVANLTGGIRRVRVSYAESVGDIIHPALSIEVKYGKQVPAAVKVTNSTFRGDYFIMPWRSRYFPTVIVRGTKKIKWLEGCLRQAGNYEPYKVPVVALKPKGYRGIIFVCYRWDRVRMLKGLKGGKDRKDRPSPQAEPLRFYGL